jgi:hypothetical protein
MWLNMKEFEGACPSQPSARTAQHIKQKPMGATEGYGAGSNVKIAPRIAMLLTIRWTIRKKTLMLN